MWRKSSFRLPFQAGSALEPPRWEVKLFGLQEVVGTKTCSGEIMGQGQGPLGYSYLVFIFVLCFSVSLKKKKRYCTCHLQSTEFGNVDYSNEHYKPRVEDLEAENC